MWGLVHIVKAQVLEKGLRGERIVPKCDPTGTNPDSSIPDCDIHVLAQAGANVLNTLIAIAIVVAVIFIMYGAIRFITSAGNPENIKKAREVITHSVIGVVIVLVAWVVINTFFTLFVNCEGSWWVFQGLHCGG